MKFKKALSLFLVLLMVIGVFLVIDIRNGRDASDISAHDAHTPPEGTRAPFDRDYLYAYSYNNRGVYRINKDGSNAQSVLNMNAPTCNQMGGAAISPDGKTFYAKGGHWGWGNGQTGVGWWSTVDNNQGHVNLNVNPRGKTFGVDRDFMYYMSDGCRSNTVVKANFNGQAVCQTNVGMNGRQNRRGYGFSVCNGYVWIASSSEWWGWETDKFTGGNLNNPDVKWNHEGGSYFSLCYDGKYYYHGYRNGLKKFDRNFNRVASYNVGYNYWIVMTPYVGIAFAENAAVLGDDEIPLKEEPICYAQYRKYTLSVDITTLNGIDDPSELRLYMDYNLTNASLCYNWTRNEFFKQQDENDHIMVLLDECTTYNDTVEKWLINFTMMFNFSFPHSHHVDCFTNVSVRSGEFDIERFPWILRVEKDMEFTGTPRIISEDRGPLIENDWVRAGENLTLDNLTVKYTGGEEVFPHDEHFDVTITDRDGNKWWDNVSSGEEIRVDYSARGVTDLDEEYFITIENIPGRGTCKTDFTFKVRLDSIAPNPPLGLLCHARNFNDKQTEYTKESEMFVTWDIVYDYESGLRGYYYSNTNNAGTYNGTFTEELQVVIDELGEGIVPVYVWCEDMVGNLGNSSMSDLLVDKSVPIFANMAPADGSWHNHSDVVCSVDVLDPEGSGVDGSTIEYTVSSEGPLGFNNWFPASLPRNGLELTATVEFNFQEGDDNYIKWRARDMSGNEHSESAVYNVKIDTTPVEFTRQISPPQDWYTGKEITASITVSDGGSGVDPNSIEYRISTGGPTVFGAWKRPDGELITKSQDGTCTVTVINTFAEGRNNYLIFRATDMVGNPYTESRKFNFKIDSTPVFFGDMAPPEKGYYLECEVECVIPLYDDGIGTDPKSVEYSISTEGPDENKFGQWKAVDSVALGNPSLVMVTEEFRWGRDNYIRWRASDELGTGITVSEPFEVWVNSKPKIVISSPNGKQEYEDGVDIKFDASYSFDEDGDVLGFYWTSNVTGAFQLGYRSNFSKKLPTGRYAIVLYVSDGTEHNVTQRVYITVKKEVLVTEDDEVEVPEKKEFFAQPIIWMIMGAVALVILILMLVLVLRKKKKPGEEDELRQQMAPPSPMPRGPTYGGAAHPYRKGQHHPMVSRKYGPQPGMQVPSSQGPPGHTPYGANGAYGQPALSRTPMLPQGQPPVQQLPPTQQQSQLPAYQAGTQVPAALPPAGNQQPDAGGAPAYSLPTFTSEAGTQDLNRMALPPGPEVAAFPPEQEREPPIQQPTVQKSPVQLQSIQPPSAGAFPVQQPLVQDLPIQPPQVQPSIDASAGPQKPSGTAARAPQEISEDLPPLPLPASVEQVPSHQLPVSQPGEPPAAPPASPPPSTPPSTASPAAVPPAGQIAAPEEPPAPSSAPEPDGPPGNGPGVPAPPPA